VNAGIHTLKKEIEVRIPVFTLLTLEKVCKQMTKFCTLQVSSSLEISLTLMVSAIAVDQRILAAEASQSPTSRIMLSKSCSLLQQYACLNQD
jgi:hypothetical protein